MKYLFIFIILFNISYAQDNIVELYRHNGIKDIQKQLDIILKTKKYWLNYLQDKDIRYGYYESIKNILVCSKNKKELFVYQNSNFKLTQTLKTSILVGKHKGDKRSEGDHKTPNGAYIFTKKLTKLDPFYGPLALVTSYPSTYDKLQNNSGHGIWIHGFPLDGKRDDYTKGCIALNNTTLKTLSKDIDYKNSILLIAPNNIKQITKNDMSNILAQLYSWRYAWKYNDIQSYLSFYNKDFKKLNKTNLSQFARYKKRIFSKNQKKTIIFHNINISYYKDNIYKITLEEIYKAPYYSFTGSKELYIKYVDQKISIITEN